MVKRRAVMIFILLVASLIIWGIVKPGIAQDRFYLNRSYLIKITEKLDEVLKNQERILKQLNSLKESIKIR